MAKRKKRTARTLAEEITLDMVETLKQRWDKFKKGDITARLDETEVKFMLDTIKLEQEAEQGDAVVRYLAEMSDKDLDAYHERLKDKLEGNNNN